MTELPAAALDWGIRQGVLPPPWFMPVEAPACADEIEVPAEITNDGIDRRFVCDRIRGHDEAHRQVLDNETGNTIEWNDLTHRSVTAARQVLAERSHIEDDGS